MESITFVDFYPVVSHAVISNSECFYGEASLLGEFRERAIGQLRRPHFGEWRYLRLFEKENCEVSRGRAIAIDVAERLYEDFKNADFTTLYSLDFDFYLSLLMSTLRVLCFYECRIEFDIASVKASLVANGVLSQLVLGEIEEYARQLQLARNLKGDSIDMDHDDAKTLMELLRKTENRVLRPFVESLESLKRPGLVSFSQEIFHRRLVHCLRDGEVYYAIQIASDASFMCIG
jgi:hypothetical protein